MKYKALVMSVMALVVSALLINYGRQLNRQSLLNALRDAYSHMLDQDSDEVELCIAEGVRKEGVHCKAACASGRALVDFVARNPDLSTPEFTFEQHFWCAGTAGRSHD